MTSPSIVLHSVAIDTPDPERLAAFYCNLAGGRVTYRSDDWVETQSSTGTLFPTQLPTRVRRVVTDPAISDSVSSIRPI